MNTDLKAFVVYYLRVVSMALMGSAIVAFLCIPYSLGSTPGDAHTRVAGADTHAT